MAAIETKITHILSETIKVEAPKVEFRVILERVCKGIFQDKQYKDQLEKLEAIIQDIIKLVDFVNLQQPLPLCIDNETLNDFNAGLKKFIIDQIGEEEPNYKDIGMLLAYWATASIESQPNIEGKDAGSDQLCQLIEKFQKNVTAWITTQQNQECDLSVIPGLTEPDESFTLSTFGIQEDNLFDSHTSTPFDQTRDDTTQETPFDSSPKNKILKVTEPVITKGGAEIIGGDEEFMDLDEMEKTILGEDQIRLTEALEKVMEQERLILQGDGKLKAEKNKLVILTVKHKKQRKVLDAVKVESKEKSKEIEDLKAKLSKMEAEVKKTESENSDLKKQNSDQIDQLRLLKEKNGGLEQEITTEQTKLKTTKEQKKSLETENGELKTKLSESKETNQKLTRDIETKQQDLTETKNKFEELTTAHTTLQNTYNEDSEQLNFLSRKTNKLEIQIEQNDLSLAQLTEKNEEISTQNQKLQLQVKEQNTRLIDLEQKALELIKETELRTGLQKKLEYQKKKIQEFKTGKKLFEQRLKQSEDSKKQLEEDIKEMYSSVMEDCDQD